MPTASYGTIVGNDVALAFEATTSAGITESYSLIWARDRIPRMTAYTALSLIVPDEERVARYGLTRP